MLSAIVRMLWRPIARHRHFNQQLLKEKMLEYVALHHLLELFGGVTTGEIQAAANDLDAGRYVGVLHRQPRGKKGKRVPNPGIVIPGTKGYPWRSAPGNTSRYSSVLTLKFRGTQIGLVPTFWRTSGP